MTMKTIKHRKESIAKTQHVIKAMNLVATAKLQKAKVRLDAIRPLFNETKRIMDKLRNFENLENNIFVKSREVKNTAYVVVMSDRGLCGSHNANVGREAISLIDAGENEKIISVGAKCIDYFRRRKKNIFCSYKVASEDEDSEKIGNLLASLYTSGEIDEAYIVYTKFNSVMSHTPCALKILPIGSTSDDVVHHGNDNMEYEPSANDFLEYAVPMYLNVIVHGAMIESEVCEEAARMISMDSAASNADKIIDDLTLMYNRIRQGAITQEINEIVNGANTQQQ